MAKANVDPSELRRFSQELTRFNNDLQGLMGTLNARVRALEGTWRDQEQRKFAEVFDQTVKGLGNFLNASHEHAVFLAKKASLIEDYLKQR
jgi:uncharacterized protein YukE